MLALRTSCFTAAFPHYGDQHSTYLSPKQELFVFLCYSCSQDIDSSYQSSCQQGDYLLCKIHTEAFEIVQRIRDAMKKRTAHFNRTDDCGEDGGSLKQSCSQLVKDFRFVQDVDSLIKGSNLTNLLLRSR